ncbi:flagellar export chaperone FlgN [Halomonas sp. Bachu 37]|uniref:flagella synthesis protein FlgN n=1 Tax=Halomonas kashgarensis TaxID=3084920 RepID=UPI003217B048
MSLARMLDDQLARLTSLMRLLEHEQQLLTSGSIDGDALASVAEQKQTLLADLERMETLRRNVQQRLGYAAGISGATQAAKDAGCHETWAELLNNSERTARMNQLTGQMLSVRMKHNQHMLDYIRQIAEKTLYQADGRNGPQSGRINASA